ncbi:hypothetical protein K1719_037984 [Acacia pycnantha]|nr:hypothetical protein K1719_037984 [Acacia pycnantha]
MISFVLHENMAIPSPFKTNASLGNIELEGQMWKHNLLFCVFGKGKWVPLNVMELSFTPKRMELSSTSLRIGGKSLWVRIILMENMKIDDGCFAMAKEGVPIHNQVRKIKQEFQKIPGWSPEQPEIRPVFSYLTRHRISRSPLGISAAPIAY